MYNSKKKGKILMKTKTSFFAMTLMTVVILCAMSCKKSDDINGIGGGCNNTDFSSCTWSGPASANEDLYVQFVFDRPEKGNFCGFVL